MNLTDIPLFKYEGSAQYQSRYDYDGSNKVIYAGIAPIGIASSQAGWRIVKYTYSGSNLTLIQCAPLYSIWDDRASLSYS